MPSPKAAKCSVPLRSPRSDARGVARAVPGFSGKVGQLWVVDGSFPLCLPSGWRVDSRGHLRKGAWEGSCRPWVF